MGSRRRKSGPGFEFSLGAAEEIGRWGNGGMACAHFCGVRPSYPLRHFYAFEAVVSPLSPMLMHVMPPMIRLVRLWKGLAVRAQASQTDVGVLLYHDPTL